MDHNGSRYDHILFFPVKRGSSTPSTMLISLLSRRSKHQEELRNIEREVYDIETSYLQDPVQFGHVLKGFEGFLSSSNKSTALSKRLRKFLPEDRLFSLSSITSPAAEEAAAARDGEPVICRGKPKKGRGREAKRMRHTNEPDFDYDDDPDVIL